MAGQAAKGRPATVTLEELKYKVDLSNWFLIANEDFEQVN